MDVVQLTLEACALVFTPLPLILLFCGVLFGTLLGALPGLGSILALTVCLPFTLMLDHIPAFALMLGTYVGSLYGEQHRFHPYQCSRDTAGGGYQSGRLSHGACGQGR